MSLLNRNSILSADDLTTEDVDVPEWGGTVRIRTLTGAERDAFELSVQSEEGQKLNLANLRARLVALCVVDEDGKRVFTDDADAHRLGMKSSAALTRVFTKAQALNGLSQKDVEELAGESDAAPSGASTSA